MNLQTEQENTSITLQSGTMRGSAHMTGTACSLLGRRFFWGFFEFLEVKLHSLSSSSHCSLRLSPASLRGSIAQAQGWVRAWGLSQLPLSCSSSRRSPAITVAWLSSVSGCFLNTLLPACLPTCREHVHLKHCESGACRSKDSVPDPAHQ